MTFAGTPDRVESRLVPEAGFELDTFPVSGLPRTPQRGPAPRGVARVRRAGPLPPDPRPAPPRRRARRRRLRRRPDGARRPVARDPGGADRGRRAPRPRQPARGAVRPPALPRVRDPRSRRREGPRRRPPDPARASRREPRGGASPLRALRRRPGRRGLRRARRARGRSTRWPSRRGAPTGRTCCTSAASATSTRSDRGSRGPATCCSPQTDHFGEALAAADLAVSRAGGTVWELAAAGTPSILVPYPHATADHQTLNARHFERGGGAVVVPDAEVGRIPQLVAELLADPERLAAMREAMLRLARPDAADVDRGRARRARPRGPVSCVIRHELHARRPSGAR